MPEYDTALLYFKVLHVDQSNPKHGYRIGEGWIESSPEDEHLEVLVDKKLSLAHQCVLAAQKTNYILAVPRAGQRRGFILPLYSTAVRPYVKSGIPDKKDVDVFYWVWRGGTKMIRQLKLSRLRELGLFLLENRRIQGDLIAPFST